MVASPGRGVPFLADHAGIAEVQQAFRRVTWSRGYRLLYPPARLRQVTGVASCHLVAPKQRAGRFTQYLGPAGGVDLTPPGRVNDGLPCHDRRIKVMCVTSPLGPLAGLPRQPDDPPRAGFRWLVH